MEKYLEMLREKGAEGIITTPDRIITAPWTVFKCQFGCDSYGKNLCCPPFTPTYDKTREILDSYKTLILFTSTDKRNVTHFAVETAREMFLDGYYKAIAFGSGFCNICPDCAGAYPCRNPSKAAPSMEGCGIDVFATARLNGFTVETLRTRSDQNHNFGLICVE